MTTRDEVVQEALSWVNTPYHHEAEIKGVEGGVDCVMMPRAVYRKFGMIPMDFDPRPYPMQWYLHHDAERYLEWFAKYGTQVTQGQPGDVALFRFGRAVSHSAILIGDGQMVHAYRKAGMVIVEPLEAYADRFHSFWSVF